MSKAWNVGEEVTADKLNDTGFGLHVIEQATPGLTLKVKPGVAIINGTVVKYAGGNTPSITAPVGNPRIDLITIDSAGTIGVTNGTPAGSPTAPAYPTTSLVLAEIYSRPAMTTIDNDDATTNGYILRDSRALITGTVAIDVTTGAPDSGKAIKTDASGLIDRSFLNKKIRFGGDGSDGALSITSGTTTLDAAGARVFIKNYSSISITGSGKLAFINPHANGTYIFLRSTGNVTLSSSQTPMIDISNMGSAGGAGFFFSSPSGTNVGQGSNPGTAVASPFKTITATSGGSPGTVTTGLVLAEWISHQLLYRYGPWLVPGSGGGSGSAFKVSGNYSTTTGTGGRGAGALLIECAGTFTFTTTNGLSTKAQDGTNSTGATGGSQTGSGGGGGGGGGSIWIFYNVAGTITGTIDQSASGFGTGQLTSGTTGSASGGGGGSSYTEAGTGGASTVTTGNGGPGAISTNCGWILNTEFA